MTLSEIVHGENIVPELKATNRWEAIDELVDELVDNGAIAKADRDDIIDLAAHIELIGADHADHVLARFEPFAPQHDIGRIGRTDDDIGAADAFA